MKQLIACIVVLVLFSACALKQQKKSAMEYSAAELRAFALSTLAMNKTKAMAATDSLLLKAEHDSAFYNELTNGLETYFGDPNSASRNEDLYIHLVQQKLRSKWCSSLQKEQYRTKLFLRMQNRPGAAANDFEYITPQGMRNRLYDINADYVLLLFYNPECEACKEMKTALIKSELIKLKVETGKLKVVAIYTDKDENIWLHHLNEMPQNWIHGRDNNEYLFKNNVYNLKAIPTVYLLDKHKNVLLKDCMDVQEIEECLNSKTAMKNSF